MDTLTTDQVPSPVAAANETKSFARHLPAIARVLLGLMLLMFGLSGLFNLMPPPPKEMPAAALAFNTGLMKAGYMMPLIFGTQALVGALLLLNRWVPLALALLAPFLVNSVAFHLFLMPQGLGIALFICAVELYLAWIYRDAFRPMLAMHVSTDR